MRLRSEDLESIAWWMDEAFQIPGTRIRFGLDAIIGVFPGLGEWITSVIQAGVVLGAVSQKDLPTPIVLRMILNVAIDSSIGAIPFLGDIFDVFFKANRRNMELLRQANAERQATGKISGKKHTLFLAGVAFALVAILLSTGYAAFRLTSWLFEQIIQM